MEQAFTKPNPRVKCRQIEYTVCYVDISFNNCIDTIRLFGTAPYTGWRTKCYTIACAHNTFLLIQKHLTSGTELILIGWKIVPNEEHVQCDHRFASQSLANEPLHSSQLFDTGLQKARGTTSLCSCATFSGLLCEAKRWSH